MGALVELALSGTQKHPFHQHVNPFQLTSARSSDAAYFQEGVWHDTLYTMG